MTGGAGYEGTSGQFPIGVAATEAHLSTMRYAAACSDGDADIDVAPAVGPTRATESGRKNKAQPSSRGVRVDDEDLKEPGENDQKSQTRERLLDAAIQIANERGINKVTYRSVATRAGVSHSLVRFYFGSGGAMIIRALERAAELDATESHILADDVESFSDALVRVISGEDARGLLQYDYLLRAVRGGVPLCRVRALYDFYLEQVTGTLANLRIDDPDGSLSALVFAALDGLVLQHSLYESDDRTEAALEHLRGVLRLLQQRGAGIGSVTGPHRRG
ncbi:TetR/AcrR family transcriptional regulator [Streptomyces sp. NPDC029554]|uniref:TetR/AcrR family transcriptional regulator n=1 Tax=Streptomyces sp. NPDC029554 TaxID=3155126 RepID=UPI00340C70D1